MSLVNALGGKTEQLQNDCPDCGEDGDVRRKQTFSLEELEYVSVWCESCGLGWQMAVEEVER